MSKTKKNHYRNVVRCEFLGSGASGCKVYSCLVKGWRCAVKELSLALSNHFETECFRMEMNLLASLPRHPNVVQYLHHQEQKEGLQLFMTQYSSTLRQYLDKRREFTGFDALNPAFNAGLLQPPSTLHHAKLATLADPSPLPDDVLNSLIDPQTVSGLAMKIAAGIQHLHHNCVLHRDLKSNNVFVCLDFSQRNITETVIGDFDTAIRVPKSYFSSSTDSSFNDTVDPVTIGTAGWMAPEVISGKKYGSAADVYSYGMLLYELMTLRIPYEEMLSTPNRVCAATLAGKRPQVPLSVQRRYGFLYDLYVRCTQHDPYKRPSIDEVCSSILFQQQTFLPPLALNETLSYSGSDSPLSSSRTSLASPVPIISCLSPSSSSSSSSSSNSPPRSSSTSPTSSASSPAPSPTPPRLALLPASAAQSSKKTKKNLAPIHDHPDSPKTLSSSEKSSSSSVAKKKGKLSIPKIFERQQSLDSMEPKRPLNHPAAGSSGLGVSLSHTSRFFTSNSNSNSNTSINAHSTTSSPALASFSGAGAGAGVVAGGDKSTLTGIPSEGFKLNLAEMDKDSKTRGGKSTRSSISVSTPSSPHSESTPPSSPSESETSANKKSSAGVVDDKNRSKPIPMLSFDKDAQDFSCSPTKSHLVQTSANRTLGRTISTELPNAVNAARNRFSQTGLKPKILLVGDDTNSQVKIFLESDLSFIRSPRSPDVGSPRSPHFDPTPFHTSSSLGPSPSTQMSTSVSSSSSSSSSGQGSSSARFRRHPSRTFDDC